MTGKPSREELLRRQLGKLLRKTLSSAFLAWTAHSQRSAHVRQLEALLHPLLADALSTQASQRSAQHMSDVLQLLRKLPLPRDTPDSVLRLISRFCQFEILHGDMVWISPLTTLHPCWVIVVVLCERLSQNICMMCAQLCRSSGDVILISGYTLRARLGG